jgi:hypothetical protein
MLCHGRDVETFKATNNNWKTRVGGSLNPKLLEGVRVLQWRWQNDDKKDLMSITGRALSKQSTEEMRSGKTLCFEDVLPYKNQ